MRPLVNPGMPTPLGFGYYLPNLSTGKAVEFDDCQQTTGRMIDYKDRGAVRKAVGICVTQSPRGIEAI